MKIFCLMSGGVDSSVAAALLKKQGFSVIGVYLKVFFEKYAQISNCPWQEDIKDAEAVCQKLNIPFYAIDVSKEYKKKVVDYMVSGYTSGITPNPDVMCNRMIKFGVFLEKARAMGAESVASGHYVRKVKSKKLKVKSTTQKAKVNCFKLLKGIDAKKDQSYFLYTLTQKQLSNLIFPLGEYKKTQVRMLAQKFKLPNWDKKDSQGLCFLGKVNLPKFLQKYIKPKKGKVKTVSGEIIGQHQGVWYYTIGQRHGFDSTQKRVERGQNSHLPYYVAKKDLKKNELIVAQGRNNPALYSQECLITNVNWISDVVTGQCPVTTINCQAKIRYQQKEQECIVVVTGQCPVTTVIVKFKKPQFAVACGQSVVFYQGDECLGGGVIKRVFSQKCG